MQRLPPSIYKEVTAFLIEHLQPSQDSINWEDHHLPLHEGPPD